MAKAPSRLTDRTGKKVLRAWPVKTKMFGKSALWLRAQPKDASKTQVAPRLRHLGVEKGGTHPDGLWLGVTPGAWPKYCDVVAVEVCGSEQNLNDKRSRYGRGSVPLVLASPIGWLSEATRGRGTYKRWKALGIDNPGSNAEGEFSIPVRHLYVLFSLWDNLYDAMKAKFVPAGHEFFCSHTHLKQRNTKKMRTFLGRMDVSARIC